MAQLSMQGDKKGSSSVQPDAKKMNAKQGREIEEMVAMLKRDFNDAYEPKLTPDNQAMVDQLKAQTGVAYNKLFYENVVKHHQQALQMIDQSMPRMQRADLKTMAEQMKREQATAIAELQRKGPGA